MNASSVLRFALRFAIAAGLLLLTFRIAIPEGGDGLAETLLASWQSDLGVAVGCFGLAIAIFGVSFGVAALRFQTLLRGARLDPGFAPLFRAYIVAGFFNLVLPGAMLGDVYRFFDVRREMGQGSEVLGMVVLERLLGLAALGSIGLVVAPFMPLADADAQLAWVLVGLCALFVAATVAILQPATNALLLRMLKPFERISATWVGRLERSLAAVAALAGRPALIARAFALSVVTQWLPVVAIWVLSLPLDSHVAWYWIAIIVPFVTMASLLPISIGGTGVREYLFVTLFGAVGMRAEVALTLSLSVLAVAIVWAVVGFAVFAIGRRSAALATP